MNSHWEDHTLELPVLPEGFRWSVYAYSADMKHNRHPEASGSVTLMSRSTMVLIGRKTMEQFSHEDPTRNAGLRLIAGIAKSINYQNNAGINTLLINV